MQIRIGRSPEHDAAGVIHSGQILEACLLSVPVELRTYGRGTALSNRSQPAKTFISLGAITWTVNNQIQP